MSISSAIQNFKMTVDPRLKTGDCATHEQLRLLQSRFRLPIPAELCDFYTDVGSIVPFDIERNAVVIDSAAAVLLQLEVPKTLDRRKSTGLIDLMKFSWGNDRPEFDEYLDRSFIEAINAKYQAFGLWRGSHFEGAHYLYFDEAGRFGSVYYDQNEFVTLINTRLAFMVNESPASGTLLSCLEKAFALIRGNILEGKAEYE